jgi:CelD/BcsL family acetyltransferase involved in cellulose biosynthesis
VVDLREVVIERFDRLDDVGADWARLARDARHPFAARAWLASWWEVHGAGSDLLAFAARRPDEAPFALLLLRRDHTGTIRFLGDGPSDIVGPISAPDDSSDAVDALARILEREMGPDDRFVATALPPSIADALLLQLPHVACTARESSPCVRVGNRSWAEYLDGRHHRRRRRLAAQADRLLARPEIEVIDSSDPADIVDALRVLIDLHGRRFGARSRSFAPPRDDFYAAALRQLADDGGATIRTLSVDGAPAAAILVLHAGGDDWFYQGGWDPTHASLSVGRSLLADTIRSAFDRGCGTFHLLRGAEEYKDQWADDDAPVVTVESRPAP